MTAKTKLIPAFATWTDFWAKYPDHNDITLLLGDDNWNDDNSPDFHIDWHFYWVV
jgi:hypothetical protein